jgi:hypothetical protein
MVYEPNESKVANLLSSMDDLSSPQEKIEALIECVAEQEKAIQALQKRLEDHEVLAPEFCKKEAEFQKKSLKERNESDDKDSAELREDLASFLKED